MDFSLGAESDAFRRQVLAFLDETVTNGMVEACHQNGVYHDPAYSSALSERGWLGLDWPVEHGGQGKSPLEALAYHEEAKRRGAPYYGINLTMMVAYVVNLLGTEEQKAEFLPRAMRAEVLIALGFTEPENGSDAAAASTRAVRDGDGWRVTGSKMFTTNAHVCDYVFMLARTNPDAPKHHGLTTFLVPLDQEGVEIRAVRTMSGERTNVTFYNDVYVEDRWRIGEVDGGWQVMGAALANEHAASFFGEQSRLLDALSAWAVETGATGDPSVQQQAGRSRTQVEVSTLLLRRAVWLKATKQPLVGLGSMSKLFSTEVLQEQADATLELVGLDGLRVGDNPVRGRGTVEHMARHAPGTTIYAGTSEIQRGIIAQHVLGLPRS